MATPIRPVVSSQATPGTGTTLGWTTRRPMPVDVVTTSKIALSS
jgi:hypothetical protein